MIGTSAKPKIDELYCTASTSSDLTVDADHRRPIDFVVAAGLAVRSGGHKVRLGDALIRLRGEWDRTAKPRKRTEAEIYARAQELRDGKGKPDVKRARVEALTQHAAAMRERAMNLSGRSVVLGLLTDWAREVGADVDLLSPAIFHFLAPTCPVCGGLGRLRHEDAPVLGKDCYHCRGAGTWPRPLGAAAIHEHFAECLNAAKSGIGNRTRG